MKVTLLAVDANIEHYEKQKSAWEKHDVVMERVPDMAQAAIMLSEKPFTIIGINGDNIEYLPYLRVMRDMTASPIHIMVSKPSFHEHMRAIKNGATHFTVWSDNPKISAMRGLALLENYYEHHRHPKHSTNILHHAGVCLFPEYRVAIVNHKTVELTEREFRILQYLMSHRGRVMSYEQIYEAVWGLGYDEADHKLLWDRVLLLRKKMSEASDALDYIESIKGVGYRFKMITS